MKKLFLPIFILTLAACTPPMKSEPNKCKCTPGHCCADTLNHLPSTPMVDEPILDAPHSDDYYPEHNEDYTPHEEIN
jgi:hypothetical protein